MEELATVLQIVPVREKIELNLNLSQTLQDKIAKYLANPANMPSLDGILPASANNIQQ